MNNFSILQEPKLLVQNGISVVHYGISVVHYGILVVHYGILVAHYGISVAHYGISLVHYGRYYVQHANYLPSELISTWCTMNHVLHPMDSTMCNMILLSLKPILFVIQIYQLSN